MEEHDYYTTDNKTIQSEWSKQWMEEHRNKDCVVRKKNKKNEFYSAAMKAKKQRKKKI